MFDFYLVNREFIVGDEYMIVDVVVWGWIDKVNVVLGEEGFKFYLNLLVWFDKINGWFVVLRVWEIVKGIEFKIEFDEEVCCVFFLLNYLKV